MIIVQLNSPQYNKLLVSYLKDLGYKDKSKVLYSGLRCTYPFFEIDTIKYEVRFLREGKIDKPEIYKTENISLIKKHIYKCHYIQIDTPLTC